MKSIKLKAATVLAATALISGSLVGCAAPSPTKPATLASIGCKDETMANWDTFSYTIGEWKHGSKTVSGFGLFSCKTDATIKISVSPNGTNLVNNATFVALGNEQLPIASLRSLDKKFINFESAITTSGATVKIPAGTKFQPLAELVQSTFGLTYGKQPVTLAMTISVTGKKPLLVKKTLALSTMKTPFLTNQPQQPGSTDA